MGNLCSSSSDKTNSTPAGRTLASAPTPQSSNARAQIPSKAKPQVQGPGRTIGGATIPAAGAGEGSVITGAGEDPRAAAARAAEERASKLQSQNKGKLGEQLAAQKRQTRSEALEEASRQERGARVADENAVTRSWN